MRVIAWNYVIFFVLFAACVCYAADTWFEQEATRKSQGQVWDKGVSAQSLARKRAPQAESFRGVNTQQAIDTVLQDISAYERKPREDSVNYGGLKPHVTTESIAWRNPITEPVRVGQEKILAKRNVVGAYADVEAGKDVKVRVGPELVLEGEKTAKYQQQEGSGLGMGMRFEWGF